MTILSFSPLLRTTEYSPPPEGWPFVGDEGSGWFFGRGKKKEERAKIIDFRELRVDGI